MAATLLQSVVDYFHRSSLIANKMRVGPQWNPWFGEAPEQEPMPYCVLLHQGETPEYDTEPGPYLAEARVQFVVYGVGLARTEDAARAVRDVYDLLIDNPAALDFSGAHVAGVWRDDYTVSAESERNADGDQVFSAAMTYRIMYREIT
jgi:hypothetical protein